MSTPVVPPQPPDPTPPVGSAPPSVTTLIIGAWLLVITGLSGYNTWGLYQLSHAPAPAPLPPEPTPTPGPVTPPILFVSNDVQVAPGDPADLEVKTAGGDVIFIAADGLQLRQTSIKKATAWGLTAGKFKVHAVTSIDGTQKSACAVVTVGTPVPPTPPTPPTPVDPFLATLQAAYTNDTDPNKQKNAQLLAGLYQTMSTDILNDTTTFKVVQDFVTVAHSTANTLIGAGGLPAVRKSIEGELNANLKLLPTAPLDTATRQNISKTFQRIGQDLSALK